VAEKVRTGLDDLMRTSLPESSKLLMFFMISVSVVSSSQFSSGLYESVNSFYGLRVGLLFEERDNLLLKLFFSEAPTLILEIPFEIS
jgi:hypothetical protein